MRRAFLLKSWRPRIRLSRRKRRKRLQQLELNLWPKRQSKLIKAILETIRERADYALKQLEHAEEQRSMQWKCKECGYRKHFTRPVPLESTGKCPRCKSTSFQAVP